MHTQTIFVSSDAPARQSSLEASDEFDVTSVPPYCPTGLLGRFVLLMVDHGRCVSTALMLADREYAMWQLACARGMGDGELADVAKRLFAYFDDGGVPSGDPTLRNTHTTA